jgi:hypothetical protein
MVSCIEATQKYNKLYAELVAESLNARLSEAVTKGDYSGKMFAKGRTEKGNSLSYNERSQGGIFWLRPQEAQAAQLDLGIPQIVGHNPGWDVRGGLWAKRNFIEADVGRRSGGTGVYADTPFMRTVQADTITRPIAGGAPNLSQQVMARLKLKAMRDTVADVFLGWDGRIRAIENLKKSDQAVKALIKSLDEQIEQRLKAGDSIGAAYLGRQKSELISPTGRDYLYGGMGFWRDIVMGRQNSVKVLNKIATAPRATITPVLSSITSARNKITRMSDYDTNLLFGKSRQEILDALDTSKIDRSSPEAYRESASHVLVAYRDLIDSGLERSMVTLLDSDALIQGYSSHVQSELQDIYGRELPYDATGRIDSERESYQDGGYRYDSATVIERSLREPATERTPRLPTGRTSYSRASTSVRQVTTPRTPESPRVPEVPRVPDLPRVPDAPRVPDTLRTPELPRVPETPKIPEIPRVPDIPDIPEMPDVPPPHLPTRIRLGVEITGDRAKLPQDSITWRQGAFWKWVPREDYATGAAKPRTLPRGVVPIGARFTDLRKPTETIQMIGDAGASVPDVAVDLGVADIFISDQAQTIRYTGKGEQTNVGTGIDSTTQGMTVEGGAEGISRPAMSKVYPEHSVSRTAIEAGEVSRPVRGINRPKIVEDTNEIRTRIKDKSDEPEDESELTTSELGDYGAFGDEDPSWLQKGVNRTKMSRRQPSRKGKRAAHRDDDDFSDLTSLKGFRF